MIFMNTHINMCFHEYDIHGYLSACRFETENPLVYYYIIFVVDAGDAKSGSGIIGNGLDWLST
jgi:hypothetical protein